MKSNFELNLNLLTVFIGHNGGGKTQAIRVLLEKIDRHPVLSRHKNVYVFPTERAALLTLNLSSATSQHTCQKDLLISNALRMLSMIIDSQAKCDSTRICNSSRIYVQLSKFLEKEILGAYVEYRLNQKQFLFSRSKNSTKTKIIEASSIVKELSLLAMYLRYLAKPNDLLIIENPETGLHPAAQIEITEFLTMLVNAGLRILITTHSPYVIDHLNNLMQASKNKYPQEVEQLFYLEKAEAFITQEKVAIYLFEDNKAENVLKKEGVIDWKTFSEVSEDVSQIYVKLL